MKCAGYQYCCPGRACDHNAECEVPRHLTMTCLRAPVLKSIWQNNALYDHRVQAWLDASRPGYYKRIDK